MAGPSAAATRSCSPKLRLTRRPCRGLRAFQNVPCFQEITVANSVRSTELQQRSAHVPAYLDRATDGTTSPRREAATFSAPRSSAISNPPLEPRFGGGVTRVRNADQKVPRRRRADK